MRADRKLAQSILYRCTITRGKGAALYLDRKDAADYFSGATVRHGTHPMCVAAILEQGGPAISEGQVHEFGSTTSIYTCDETELAPFQHATRARILKPDQQFTGAEHASWPPCQFIFRGVETMHGAATKSVRSYGYDHQAIYPDKDGAMWTELQVWVGWQCKRNGTGAATTT